MPVFSGRLVYRKSEAIGRRLSLRDHARYAQLASDHLATAARRIDSLLAVTISLHQKAQGASANANPSNYLVGRVGIEPTTKGLRG
jgi:hypothetical protein